MPKENKSELKNDHEKNLHKMSVKSCHLRRKNICLNHNYTPNKMDIIKTKSAFYIPDIKTKSAFSLNMKYLNKNSYYSEFSFTKHFIK